MVLFETFKSERPEEVKAIYEKENWNAYLRDDEALKRAFDNSLLCFGAFDEKGRLLGFARCVGDGEHIVVVQDLIVDRDMQRNGIGSELFRRVWDMYSGVRMFQVVADTEDELDNRFYRSFGMKPIGDANMISYMRVNG